jgi:hypothetical protein
MALLRFPKNGKLAEVLTSECAVRVHLVCVYTGCPAIVECAAILCDAAASQTSVVLR